MRAAVDTKPGGQTRIETPPAAPVKLPTPAPAARNEDSLYRTALTPQEATAGKITPARSKKSLWIAGGGAAGLVVLLGVGLALFLGRKPVGKIILTLDPPDAEVLLDGSPLAAGALAGEIPIAEGEHRLEIS